MVLAGQFLERPALVATADGLALEGLFHRGARRPALLVVPAPGPGGGMDAASVAELAWAAARARHPSLRFAYRGIGASQGDPDPARAVDDAEAAYHHLAESAGPRIAIAAVGAGAGAALALARAHPEVERVVLVGAAEAPALRPIPGTRILALLPEGAAARDAEALLPALGPGGRVELVEGADARFTRGLPALGRAAIAWITARS